jgi:hypothetical protein
MLDLRRFAARRYQKDNLIGLVYQFQSREPVTCVDSTILRSVVVFLQ